MNEDGRRGHDARKATPRGALRRGILAFITTFLLLATITALVVWLIYRPEKPNFTVVGVAIYTLNTTAPPFIETSMQFNLLARNPNRRVSLFYYHLSATVHYRDQAITPPVQLPPLVQERHSTVFLSPVVGGGMIPVSAEVMEGVAADVGYGAMGLSLVMVGRVRYKAGAIRTGFHGVSVVCDLLVGLKTAPKMLKNILEVLFYGEHMDGGSAKKCSNLSISSYVLLDLSKLYDSMRESFKQGSRDGKSVHRS